METPRLIAELARHHDAVAAHLSGTRKLLALSPELALPQIARRRWELIRLLRGYQLFKHVELFDPLIRRRGPTASLAADMKARCVVLGEEVTAHIRRWSSSDAIGAWRQYVVEEAAMIERLRGHLRREREEAQRLAPAAATPGASTRAAPPPAATRPAAETRAA